MSSGGNRNRGARWSAAAWVAGVLGALVALPLSAAGRLPERVATHWGDGGHPDGSLPRWAVPLFPALIWAVLVLVLALLTRRTTLPARPWFGATLLFTGVLLTGAQAAIVHANLDRADWAEADGVGAAVALTLGAALLAGLLGLLVGRRGTTAAAAPAGGPVLDVPVGERFVWLSWTTNPWLQLTAAVFGLASAAGAIAAAGGLIDAPWAAIAPLALVAAAVLGCSSVQARVTPEGLEVAFGPAGWPVRRWPVQDIESARVEQRTPAQVGGWGYRLSGLGTTVMLRRGECLVVHPRTGAEFAVSVDDAERGAALLNTLAARRADR
ncbi:DUF1648 domain-containing protein [Kitasatospora sp. NPDC001603]|uniref:DUF1648 domain-containing protein n=1 Tax=Kitasatospora sp. NPDC001603 TaxID=3154388 RepID=UPI00332C5419